MAPVVILIMIFSLLMGVAGADEKVRPVARAPGSLSGEKNGVVVFLVAYVDSPSDRGFNPSPASPMASGRLTIERMPSLAACEAVGTAARALVRWTRYRCVTTTS